METILKTGYTKIFSLFYPQKMISLHLREIARKTKLNVHSTSRILFSLEKEAILKTEKEGNLKKYTVNASLNTFLLCALFDLEKKGKIEKRRQRAIDIFLRSLEKQPIIAFLFGSTAKGLETEGSDIDILFIENEKIDTNNAENETEALTGIKINVLQISLQEFKKELKIKEDHIIQTALKTGYPITNHIFFYEVYFHENI